jgi:glycosyltransferase involved in cell wall biosynthesis
MHSISIIVPTFNGANKISVLLDALALQTLTEFELVIVVDGSTDNTVELLKIHEKRFNAFRVITQQNSGRSKVRNKGAKEACGDLLIFYDDDMEPYPDSVEKHMGFHRQSQGILSGNQLDSASKSKPDVMSYKAYLTQSWMTKYKSGITQLSRENLFFTAANCSMPKQTFNQLHGFDDRLNDSEDYDFAIRALETGISVFFDKNNYATHHDYISCKSYIKRLREYENARKRLISLNPDRVVLSQGRHSWLKKLFYLPFASQVWATLIDQEFFVRILPTRLRYRLYSVVIQALAIEYPSVRLK